MPWSLFWQVIVLSLLGTLELRVIIDAFFPARRERHACDERKVPADRT